MSCKRYQRLLHLNRAGEISRKEAEELREHLRLCERCASELRRIERAGGFMEHLRTFSPQPAEPEKLTTDILRRVRAESAVQKPMSPIDRIFDFFLLPPVRFSSIVLVVIITMTLALQLGGTLTRIADLEQLVASPPPRDTAEPTYTLQSKTLREVAASERGKPLMDNIGLTLTNGQIEVSVKDVDSFLSASAFNNLTSLVGTSAFGIDRKTMEQIVNEVQATAGLTFRIRHEGA